MTYTAEFNPRDFKSFHDLIDAQQKKCWSLSGQYFDLAMVKIGQMQANGEIWFLEAQLTDIKQERKQPADTVKEVHVHIASLGTFNIDSRQCALSELKEKVTEALVSAINSVK